MPHASLVLFLDVLASLRPILFTQWVTDNLFGLKITSESSSENVIGLCQYHNQCMQVLSVPSVKCQMSNVMVYQCQMLKVIAYQCHGISMPNVECHGILMSWNINVKC